ncbi:hypothetical protein HDV00_008062 [Rhizophlyctis rosea]|nr:hypothetical protein HDV00_008062 [Rhizophlyctis rosea]
MSMMMDLIVMWAWCMKAEGADIHYKNDTALHAAIDIKNATIVKYLLDHGADIERQIRPGFSRTPLGRAASCGSLAVVRCLVERGADVHADHDAPLKYAAEVGDLAVVRYLVEECGAIIDARPQPYWGKSAPWYAASKGHLKCSNIMSYLLGQGADVDWEDLPKKDESTLSKAIKQNNPHRLKMIKFLVEHGADVNFAQGRPLLWAASRGNPIIVRYLLDRGAKHIDKALGWASGGHHGEMMEDRLKVMEMLLESGADIHYNDDEALRIACDGPESSYPVIKFLLQHGANIGASNGYALTCSLDSDLKWMGGVLRFILEFLGSEAQKFGEALDIALCAASLRWNEKAEDKRPPFLNLIQLLLTAGASVERAKTNGLEGAQLVDKPLL